MTIYTVRYTFTDNTTVENRYIDNFDSEQNFLTYHNLTNGYKEVIKREIIATLYL